MSLGNTIPFNDLSRTPSEILTKIEAAIARVVASGWFVMGPEHDAFEQELGAYLGIDHVVLLGNGTDALELALAAVGVRSGDRVLTVANAGAYTATATRLLGAVPIFCDVSSDNLLMTADGVRQVLASTEVKPAAIVVTHLYGAMAPVEEIATVAREHGVAVVEDCAQSIGATLRGRQSGTFGDIATTSFYPTKNLGALGDGGAIFTDHQDLADSVRRMRQYGWDSKYHIAYDHGRNSRMDEIQAAILRVKLPYLDALNDRRRDIHSQYERAASPDVRLVNTSGESFTAHLAVLMSRDRDSSRMSLRQVGISTDVHYPIPDNKQDFLSNRPEPVALPATEQAARSVFSIPMFPELTDDEVSRICAALAELS